MSKTRKKKSNSNAEFQFQIPRLTTSRPSTINLRTSKSGGLQLTIRGTGSSGNSTTLKDLKTGKSLVLDAGIKPSKKFAKENILAVLITHRHTDHYSYASAYHDTPIIGSPLELYIKTDNVKFIETGETVVYGPFEITALSADHDTDDPLHYFIKCRDMSVFYGCDAVSLPSYYDKYFEQADIIMLDCNYDASLMQNDASTYEPYSDNLKLRIVNKGHASTQYIRDRMKKYESKLVLCHLSLAYNKMELVEEKIPKCIAAVDKTRCPLTIRLRNNNDRDSENRGRNVQGESRLGSRKNVKKTTRKTRSDSIVSKNNKRVDAVRKV